MRILLVLLVFLAANWSQAQSLSKGKMRLREAMEFQSQLSKGSISLMDVRDEWTRASKDPEVRKDKDALAIAYASRAIVERDLAHLDSADSLFTLAMPLFELKASKAYFLLTHAILKRDRMEMPEALELFTEIATDFDSLPQLQGISFYAKSGYAELAYGIDAARNIAIIGYTNPKLKSKAITSLTAVVKEHPSDQLGLMALVGLEKVDPAKAKIYQSKKERLIGKRTELEELARDFALELK